MSADEKLSNLMEAMWDDAEKEIKALEAHVEAARKAIEDLVMWEAYFSTDPQKPIPAFQRARDVLAALPPPPKED